jgi:hypothetical protein
MINLPLIGATTFHLFTSYPIEPDWIVRHRRIQLLPYLAAFALGALAIADHALGLRAGLGSLVALSYTLGLFVVSFVIVAFERHRHGEGAQRNHADVVFFGALVSFLPVLIGLIAELTVQTPFPYYVPLLWTFVFPLAVGYGIVRRQLFEVRSLAKSSAAYGAATLAITGAFALAISFADALVARFGVSERPAQVALLFVAILLFNPARNRMQALVDRFFDRDRAAYRVAVREISEAMVSMLSLGESWSRSPTPWASSARWSCWSTTRASCSSRSPHGGSGTRARSRRRSPPIIRSGSTCGCVARTSRGSISTTSTTSRAGRPAATSSTRSRSSCWCRSSTASICWA